MTPEGLLERISQLEREVTALEDISDRERASRKAAERARDAETLRVRELEEAFVRYGWHDVTCAGSSHCDCGFDAALKKVVE